MNGKRCQSAFEFVIMLAFVFFFFILFYTAIQVSMADRIKERNTLALKNLGFGVKNEIDLAYSAGNGYFREFNVPENLNGIPYNISSVAGMIYLATEKDSMGINIPEIDGSIQKGRNFIRKENNIIYLN